MCLVFLLHREQDFCNFCCKPSKIKFCIEGVSVGEIRNTLLDWNEGDLSPHTSQTIYFSKTNENKRSDKVAPMGEVVDLESGIEPLSIIFINIRRHSVLSCMRLIACYAESSTSFSCTTEWPFSKSTVTLWCFSRSHHKSHPYEKPN